MARDPLNFWGDLKIHDNEQLAMGNFSSMLHAGGSTSPPPMLSLP